MQGNADANPAGGCPQAGLSSRKHFLRYALALLVLFLIGRLLVGNYRRFWEGDDTSMAIGVASMIRDTEGPTYRYAPQVGYYRLVQLVTVSIGGDISTVPVVMAALSAIAGAVVPFLGLLVFPDRLTERQRLLLALILYANPILWVCSDYGNSAMVSLAFVTGAVVTYSRRRGLAADVTALTLLAIGVLVRADAVLLAPLIALLIYHQHRALRAVVIRAALFAAVLAVVYGLLFAFDTRMSYALGVGRGHFLSPFRTQFWTYLLWSFSPIPLVFAVWGLRDIARRDGRLLATVAVWCLPVFGFYFTSCYTPRYFLLAAMPVSLCGAIGLEAVAGELARRFRARRVWGVLLACSVLHLVVGLGQFSSQRFSNIFLSARMSTHDGPMPTGALIVHSLRRVRWTVSDSAFGAGEPITVAGRKAFADLANDDGPPRTVFVVLDAWPCHSAFYDALLAGATFTAYKPYSPFQSEAWLALGRHRIMMIQANFRDYEALESFPAVAGDELWFQGESFVATAVSKLPDGLELEPLARPAGGYVPFRFTGKRRPETPTTQHDAPSR